MSSYKIQFPWTARFKDGSELRQFNIDGSENLFKKVLERRDLTEFEVGPVTVDLRDGSFLIHGVKLTGSCGVEAFEEWGIDERLPKRIIYFRRVKRDFDSATLQEKKDPYVVYAVGWQALIPPDEKHPNGCNVKHIVFIHPNGELVVE